jgi:hypothetical protein
MGGAKGVRDKLRVLLVSGEPHSGERTWRPSPLDGGFRCALPTLQRPSVQAFRPLVQEPH